MDIAHTDYFLLFLWLLSSNILALPSLLSYNFHSSPAESLTQAKSKQNQDQTKTGKAMSMSQFCEIVPLSLRMSPLGTDLYFKC